MVNPRNPDLMITSTLEKPAKLVRTEDGGRTWTAVLELPPETSFWWLAFDPGDPRTLWASGPCAGRSPLTMCLYEYDDLRRRLEVVQRLPERVTLDATVVVDGRSRVYLWREDEAFVERDTNGRFHRSTDRGRSFEPIAQPAGGATLVALHAEDDPSGRIIGVARAATPAGSSLVESDDGGASWRPLLTGVRARRRGGTRNLLADVSFTRPRHILVNTDRGVLRSEDDGKTFDVALFDTALLDELAVAPSAPKVLLAFSGGALARSEDAGVSWSFEALPFFAGERLAVDPTDARTVFVAPAPGEGAGLHRTRDAGKTWTRLLAQEVHEIVVPGAAPGMVQVRTNEEIMVSLDGGETWPRRVTRNLRDLVVADAVPTVAYATQADGVILATTDGWQTYTTRATGRKFETIELVAHPRAPGTFYLVGERLALKTVDGGQTFVPATWLPFDPGAFEGGSIRYDPGRPDRLWATTDARLAAARFLRSDDDGRTWKAVGRGLPHGEPKRLVFDPTQLDVVYTIPFASGIFKTTTAGE